MLVSGAGGLWWEDGVVGEECRERIVLSPHRVTVDGLLMPAAIDYIETLGINLVPPGSE